MAVFRYDGLLSTPTQFWTVTIALLSECELELHATLDSESARGPGIVRCGVQAGLEQLELLFACTPEAEFRLVVRSPDGNSCYLTTRRWRFALYFITSQYERAFVSAPQTAKTSRTAEHAEFRGKTASPRSDSEDSTVARLGQGEESGRAALADELKPVTKKARG
jgi:hypothetical protein